MATTAKPLDDKNPPLTDKSLRDDAALSILQGLLAFKGDAAGAESLAKSAYELADAMIARRKQQ